MSKLDLIFKDIPDRHIRENFFRIKRFSDKHVLFDGDFTFFEISIDHADDNYSIEHGLDFIPIDIIPLSVSGDHNFWFKYQNFTRDHIFLRIGGPVHLRFLAGKLSDLVGRAFVENFPLVGPGEGPTAPVPTYTPRLVARFNTDAGTAVGDLVVVNGVDTVTAIPDNSAATIPNGVFGVGYYKPSPVLIDVLFAGIMSGYAGFTAGVPLFVSTSGVPTHTVPATGMVQQIGFAINSTEFFMALMVPMRRS